jgi:Uma2 family endonuclease
MKAITKFSQLDPTKRYTYADYLTWKFQERVELIKGWLYKMTPAPNMGHQAVSVRLLRPMLNYFESKKCNVFTAPFDVRLLDKRKQKNDNKVYTVVQPDICVVCDDAKLDERGCIGAPDWIIEILSPGNTKREMQVKYDLYEENGVREYWIVHPGDHTIAVFELKERKYQFKKFYVKGDKVPCGLFRGLKIDTAKVFS